MGIPFYCKNLSDPLLDMYLNICGNLHAPLANAVLVRLKLLLAIRGTPIGRPTLYFCGRAEAKLFGRAILHTVRDGVERSQRVRVGAIARPAARVRARGRLR